MEIDTTFYDPPTPCEQPGETLLEAVAPCAFEPVEEAFAVQLADTPLEGGQDPAVGTVTWRTMISNDRTPSRDLILGIADFSPHGTLNPHRHEPPEFYLGLEGDGVVTIDGVPHPIAKNQAIYIPSNAEHGVVAGSSGLSMAYGFAKGAFSDIEYLFSERGNT